MNFMLLESRERRCVGAGGSGRLDETAREREEERLENGCVLENCRGGGRTYSSGDSEANAILSQIK